MNNKNKHLAISIVGAAIILAVSILSDGGNDDAVTISLLSGYFVVILAALGAPPCRRKSATETAPVIADATDSD